jgi:hypothetical protein
MLCGKNLTPWPLTVKINRVPDSPKDNVCTKFGQNPLKDVDSRVFTRMFCGKNLTRWHWPLTWKIIRVQTLLRTKYVTSLVKIHWKMLILECSQGCYTVKKLPSDLDHLPMSLKINRVPDSPKDYVCSKFSQNPLKGVDSRVCTKMLCRKYLTRWHWPLTYFLENQ